MLLTTTKTCTFWVTPRLDNGHRDKNDNDHNVPVLILDFGSQCTHLIIYASHLEGKHLAHVQGGRRQFDIIRHRSPKPFAHHTFGASSLGARPWLAGCSRRVLWLQPKSQCHRVRHLLWPAPHRQIARRDGQASRLPRVWPHDDHQWYHNPQLVVCKLGVGEHQRERCWANGVDEPWRRGGGAVTLRFWSCGKEHSRKHCGSRKPGC